MSEQLSRGAASAAQTPRERTGGRESGGQGLGGRAKGGLGRRRESLSLEDI